MKRRDFGADARVCFAAVVRWVLRVAGVIGLEKAPAPCKERKERGTRVEMDSAVSHTTRLARGNRWWGVATGLVIGWASVAGAATYYVDATNGSDSANGTTTATAWKTINKVNTSTFAAGDQILFKRASGGRVWCLRRAGRRGVRSCLTLTERARRQQLLVRLICLRRRGRLMLEISGRPR